MNDGRFSNPNKSDQSHGCHVGCNVFVTRRTVCPGRLFSYGFTSTDGHSAINRRLTLVIAVQLSSITPLAARSPNSIAYRLMPESSLGDAKARWKSISRKNGQRSQVPNLFMRRLTTGSKSLPTTYANPNVNILSTTARMLMKLLIGHSYSRSECKKMMHRANSRRVFLGTFDFPVSRCVRRSS